MTYLLIILGGLLYRQRGGGISIPVGTQGARLIWCLPTGALVGWLSGAWHIGLLVAVMAFAGLMIPHGRYQDDGTCGGTPLSDAIGMSAVCLARGVLIAVIPAALYWPGSEAWRATIMAGLPALAGGAYWIGWRIPSEVPVFGRGCPLGEFFTGCLFWAGILFAFTL